MKKIILALSVLAVVGSQVQSAHAGDREWAVAGKVLTGIAAASIVAHAVQPAPVYYTPSYVVATPPPPVAYAYASAPVVVAPARVVCQPAPVVVYQAPVYVQTVPVVSVYGPYSCRPRFFGREHFRRF